MKKTAGTKKIARMSDAAVQARTGKTWPEWFEALDAIGARDMAHKQIAAYLYNKLGVPGWWAQMVTVGYEQARGMREKHQRPTGYEISVSKTLSASTAKAYKAWEHEKARRRWLPETPIIIHKATPNKSMRITWTDGQKSVDVSFYPRGNNKSQVVVQHGKLPDAKQAGRMKSFWGEKLDRLKGMLEA